MTRFTTISLTGLTALAFTACGDLSSTSTVTCNDGTTSSAGGKQGACSHHDGVRSYNIENKYAYTEYPEAPLSEDGNQILLTGYKYNTNDNEVFELYSEKKNIVTINGQGKFNVYDDNYNEVLNFENINKDGIEIEPGHYYISVSDDKTQNNNEFELNSRIINK